MSSIHTLPPAVHAAAPARPVDGSLPRVTNAPAASATAWLDAGHAGSAMALHVGRPDARLDIDRLEQAFIAALCEAAPAES